jgi:hypothetical protein
MIFADISSVESIATLAPRHIWRECGRHKPSRCHRLSVTDKRFSRQPAACLRKLSHIPGKSLGAASHLHNFAVEAMQAGKSVRTPPTSTVRGEEPVATKAVTTRERGGLRTESKLRCTRTARVEYGW